MLSDLAPRAGEVLLDQMERKRIVARRDGRVRREDRRPLDLFERVVERPSLLDHLADALQRHERGVAFVQVPHGGLDAERAQRAHAADTEDDFLLDARLAVAAVEPRRQLAVPRRVFREIGVEEEQAHAAKAHAPDGGQHRPIAERHRGDAGAPVGRDGRFNRRIDPADTFVALLLPAVIGHALAEVALRVHESDADERQAEVRGFFAVIAGEHAQATRIDRQRLVQRKLGGKVRDASAAEHGLLVAPPWVRDRPRLIEAEDRLVVGTEKFGIRSRCLQLLRRDPLQHLHRVVRGGPPERVIELAERSAGRDRPSSTTNRVPARGGGECDRAGERLSKNVLQTLA